MRYWLPFFFVWLFLGRAVAQPDPYTMANAHSHNDYEQKLPFYGAYARHFGSIEADVWAVKGKLMVAHDKKAIRKGRNFTKLYLSPLMGRLKVNKGKAYKNGQPLQLLIDLKSSYTEVLPILKKLIQPYYHYFDTRNNPDAVRLVISGNMPPPDSLHYFDPVFTFDGRIGNVYPEKDLQRVVLVSDNVQKFVRWNKEHPLSASGFQRLGDIVDSIHRQRKLIRFWASPNTTEAYKTLMKLGVDYIGSDKLKLLESLLTEKKNLPLQPKSKKIHE